MDTVCAIRIIHVIYIIIPRVSRNQIGPLPYRCCGGGGSSFSSIFIEFFVNVSFFTLFECIGYIDESFIAHRMNIAFKSCAKTQGPGNVNFTEFFAVAGRLGLVAPGTQSRVEALYNRYDVDGTGILRYEHFTSALMGLIPNGETTQQLRTALNSFRRAAGRTNSYAMVQLSAVLHSTAAAANTYSSSSSSDTSYATVPATYSPSALNPPSDFISRANAQRLILMNVPEASRYDVQTILAEASRPHGGNNINPREFSLMLRGNLPRNRRSILSDVWNNYLVPLKNSQGYVSLNNILPETETSIQKYLPTKGFATEHEFIEFYRYISSVIVNDSLFDDHIQLTFGVNKSAGSRAPAVMESRSSSSSSATTTTSSFPFSNLPSLNTGNTLVPSTSAASTLSGTANIGLNSTLSRSTIRGRGVAASSTSSTTYNYNSNNINNNNTTILPGSPLAVFKGIAEGRIPPEPGINDVGNMVGVCLYNTLGRRVPPIGKEVILGRPQRVPQPSSGLPFGVGANQAVPVGTMLLRGAGINVSKDNKTPSSAAAEYLKYAGNGVRGNPQWRHNTPTSLFGRN